jgi:hypothetical protein
MADKKISALTAASTPLAGTEVLPIVQSGATVKVAVSDLTAGRAIAATSLTTAAVQATNSGGLTLKNSSGTTQLSLGAGGGDNITLSVATNITPANAAVAISPTGTGTVTINPAAASTINNTSIGATTALTGRFTSVTATTGSFVVGTSGQGVDFSATAGTGTSELLADYEEGTWTPIATPTGGSLTAYDSGGAYTKVGRAVTIQGYITLTTVGTASGYLQYSGLPFTSFNGGNGATGQTIGTCRESAVTGVIYTTLISNSSTSGNIQSTAGGNIVWTNTYTYAFAATYMSA